MTSQTQKGANDIKSVFYDLTRVGEWWLLSLGMMLFAFIPYLYQLNGDVVNLRIMGEFFMTPAPYLAITVAFAAQMFLFASNDYFDSHVDALDEKKKERNPVSAGRVTSKAFWALMIGTTVISLGCSLYFGLWPMIFTAFSLFVFYFYTAEPLRFKNKIGLDILSHAFFINTFPYLFAILSIRYFTTGSLFLWVVIMIRSAMAQILQHTRDYEVDSKVERNSVVVIGQKRALIVVLSLFIALITLTATLMITYQLFGVGISHYYLIILILALMYVPNFRGLLKADDYGDHIEKLWMGQGRTNMSIGVRYTASFVIYFAFVYLVGRMGFS